MASYFDLLRVQGLCSCSRSCPISQLYFCRHCYDVRCGNCVSHEVDSHYCPNCLENMTSAEAKMRKHRCGNCFDCPSCGHTLSTRGTLALAPVSGPNSSNPSASGEVSMTPQKTYYLLCSFCRWTTRESGIPDQKTPGGWQESPNENAERIETLVNEYRQLAVKEKSERDRSKARKRNYFMERFSTLNPRFRRRFSNWNSHSRDQKPGLEVKITPAEAKSITSSFGVDGLVKQPFVFEKVTSLQQRHLTPWQQVSETVRLEPRHKALAMKRSLRCKQCEHTLSKADFNPSFIKFRINLSALYHVPDLRFALPPATLASALASTPGRITPLPLPAVSFDSVPAASLLSLRGVPGDAATDFVLVVANPAHHSVTVHLRQLTPAEETERLAVYLAKNCPDCTTYSTVKLEIPDMGILIAAKSDAIEYSDLIGNEGTNELSNDDPKVIAYRQGHRVGIHARMKMLPETERASKEQYQVRATVLMSFVYLNTAVAAITSTDQRATSGSTTAPSTVSEQPSLDRRDVSLLFLLDFGTAD